MMTPESIASKRFDKQMGGYKQDDVERFLAQVAEDYSRIQTEKEELEGKIAVLAEKIEQYREDEDSLRNALIGAQKLGDSVIRESKAKAEFIVREARIKTDKMLDSAQKSIEKEHIALVKMQKEVTKFKNRLLTLYKQHLEMISALPDYDQEDEEASEAPQQQRHQPTAQAAPQAPNNQEEEQQEHRILEKKQERSQERAPAMAVATAPTSAVATAIERKTEKERRQEKPEISFLFHKDDDDDDDTKHYHKQEEVHMEQSGQQSQMFHTDMDSSMVIDFNSAIEQQEIVPSGAHKNQQNSKDRDNDSSKFGPLKFGEGFDVERDNAGKSLFSKKKHR